MKTFYYPDAQGDESGQAEDSRGCPYWTALESARARAGKGQSNPPRLGQLLQDGQLKEALLEHRQIHDVHLSIMLRKKHKKRSKGWRDHPPSWFYDYQGLFKLYSLKSGSDPARSDRLVRHKAARPKTVGKPCAGKLHARFDEGPLRRSLQISGLLYRVRPSFSCPLIR